MALIAVLGLSGRQHRVWTFLTAWLATFVRYLRAFYAVSRDRRLCVFRFGSGGRPRDARYDALASSSAAHRIARWTLHHIGFVDLDGIVTVPSFHAAAAVILAWAAWIVRAIRWPAFLLNVAMLMSSVPIGEHYLIDIVAGCVVAAIGLSIACRIGEPAGDEGRIYRPPSRRVSAATQLARSIVLPSGSRASR